MAETISFNGNRFNKSSACRDAIEELGTGATPNQILNWVQERHGEKVRFTYGDAAGVLQKERQKERANHQCGSKAKRGQTLRNKPFSDLLPNLILARDFLKKVGGVNNGRELIEAVASL